MRARRTQQTLYTGRALICESSHELHLINFSRALSHVLTFAPGRCATSGWPGKTRQSALRRPASAPPPPRDELSPPPRASPPAPAFAWGRLASQATVAFSDGKAGTCCCGWSGLNCPPCVLRRAPTCRCNIGDKANSLELMDRAGY